VKERFDEMEIQVFLLSALTGEGVERLMGEVIHRVEVRREGGLETV
jgi:hypothetical protein